MRTFFPKILLAFLLLAFAGVYANAGNPGDVPLSSAKATASTVYVHSSLKSSNKELGLTVTHAVRRNSQQVSLKKIQGFAGIENVQVFGACQDRLFSFPTATADSRSAHLLLIFPFHYFW